MERFNKLFQKSSENTTCQLYSEMSKLVRLYASNLLKIESITAVGDNLKQLSFSSSDQLADEELGIGDATWVYLSEMEEDYETKPFFKAVRSFYVDSLKKLLKKLPFGDMKDLGIINPDQVCGYSFSTVKSLAKRFPQLGLDSSIDVLRD